MHVADTSHVITISLGPFYAGDLIGFTTALIITVLLLVLTLRAAKLPGSPLSNIGFAICALLWTLGGLLHTAMIASGMPGKGVWALTAQAIQMTGAGAFPIPVLAVWLPFGVLPWQKKVANLLRIAAWVLACSTAIVAWLPVILGSRWFPLPSRHLSLATAATLLLVAGAATSLRRDTMPRALYLPSLAITLAVSGAALAMAVAFHAPTHTVPVNVLVAVASHLLLLLVLCSFFLFARFRFADVFIRYGVRILLAGLWASVLAFTTQAAWLRHLAVNATSPGAVHVFGVIIVANVLLLSFTFVDESISAVVNRWLFRAPDYRAVRRQLAARLAGLSLETEIAAAVEEAARSSLELSGSRILSVSTLEASAWPAGLLEGETVELALGDPLQAQLPIPNIEVLFPIASAGRVTHALLVSPGPARPGLVTHDLDFLRALATQCGNRLDALRREGEAIDRQSREALLQQQVTEAELRALRAQINPHFLFNSLNTVADLIVRDPPRAEAMTLRLASVFRHVLANSARPLTTVRDEIEFLRTYLNIEEARFGDRLKVEFDVAPSVANEHIPSLILQPIVENALKHGLGPKPGPGHLWISAQVQGNQIRLQVEDDGMGLRTVAPNQAYGLPSSNHVVEPQGLGLANVAERLKTLYHDRASITIEPREGGGSRVTVLIPRGEAAETI